jgi:NAD(P)-dependent dehydrogenase (short-subunit alcohol dehydrogenase family)
VIAVDFEQARLDDTEARLAAQGSPCITILANVRDVGAVESAVATAIESAGRVDHLVNVAGGNQNGEWSPLEKYPDRLWEDVMGLNLRYVVVSGREVAAHLIERGAPGSIVNFSSISALGAAPFHALYGVAKAGILALTKTMAVEWGRYGIRANAIVPGSVATPRADRPGSDDLAAAWNPIPRRCRPDELAGAVLFLLSDLSSAITGQEIVVDNGVSARHPNGGIERFAGMLEGPRAAHPPAGT